MMKLNFQFQAEADSAAAMVAVIIIVVVLALFAIKVVTRVLKAHGRPQARKLADWLSKQLED